MNTEDRVVGRGVLAQLQSELTTAGQGEQPGLIFFPWHSAQAGPLRQIARLLGLALT